MDSNTLSKLTAILADLDANVHVISQYPLGMRVAGAFTAVNAIGAIAKAANQLRAELQLVAPAAESQTSEANQWVLVPTRPTHAMISAMACSQACDDEGTLPMMTDLLDFSGEHKTHTVLRAAYAAMLTASPAQAINTEVAGT